MPFVHIVLVKIKNSESLESLKAEAQTFEKKEEIKNLAEHVTWGPPVYTDRAKGFDYGLYSVFKDKAKYEEYRDLPYHKEWISSKVVPNVEDIIAYDFEY
ncbi:uncharacterized protein FA14DRAFT_160199 [Meira miltonrushii]|uniref:Stress-response A/B barrel domain-containing protein n=1 Tax=Meira miltonrushii TaxID=1280837 RepID=A0A316VB54_9BASI|nr:uncharacterized protein FA14DRAFT_160199 [Meira miltonrushii]PWN34710.1 hypothetical protein FA14DRAFT_160199 [Meira miltonrushii]